MQKPNKYPCNYCGKSYPELMEAVACKESHRLVYVALSSEDLNRLLMFIFRKDDALLTDKLVERLQNYHKKAVQNDIAYSGLRR